jgi:RNA polymerase sigma-70 factor (ECF subfamily)
MQDEIEMITRVLGGETEMFRPIVEHYHVPVYRFIKSMVSNSDLASDLTQDVFVAAYKNLQRFDRRRGSFTTWLFTIAKNHVINDSRKKRPIITDPIYEPTCGNSEPLNEAGFKEFAAELDNELNKLPPDQKRVFVFAELQDLPHEQIAEIENVSVGTVKSRLSRAKEKLRAAMEKFNEYK